MRQAVRFLREFQGVAYEDNQLELLRAALDRLTLRENQPDASSVFCSEMAILLHRRVGIMEPPGAPANEFTPADYAGSELPVTAGYGLFEAVAIEA